MKIFNKWGQEVFSTTDISVGWNGMFRGKPQPVGVYPYVLQAYLTNGQLVQNKGAITLVR